MSAPLNSSTFLSGSCTKLCWIRISGTAELCIKCKYHSTQLLVGLFTFCITLESHWRTVRGVVGCFFSLKPERYTQWLPFGTSLNLLGGFVFLFLLCGIHSSPWLSVTYKYSSKLHLSILGQDEFSEFFCFIDYANAQ